MSGDPLSLDRRVRVLEERDRADAIAAAVTAETVRQLGEAVRGLDAAVGALQTVCQQLTEERESRRARAGFRRWGADFSLGLVGAIVALFGSGLVG